MAQLTIHWRTTMTATLQDLSVALHEVLLNEKLVFCDWEPQSLDSTTFSRLFLKFKITLLDGRVYSININANNAIIFKKIFEKINAKKTIPLLGHNWKEVFTFVLRVTKQPLILKGVVDLAWFESYLRLDTTKSDYKAQVRLFKQVVLNDKIWGIYKQVYEPLITQTVPAMESFGLINDQLGQMVYPNYHIEGQENGRLSCSCNFKRCYNPHSLGELEKKELVLNSEEFKFLSFDYRNMEVTILANISHDDILLDIIKNKSTRVYETIFEMVTGVKEHSEARSLGKKMFLPCIYGQGVNGLANSLDISKEQASIYLDKLARIFKQSFTFVENNQKKAAQQNSVVDFFGRVRHLKTEDAIKARNFVVQSPAALICLEFLNDVQHTSNNLYQLAFSVHDGYYIVAHNKNLQDAYHLVKKTLTKRSRHLDVELQVSAKIGKNLSKMISIGK